jgi:hypothetical protein
MDLVNGAENRGAVVGKEAGQLGRVGITPAAIVHQPLVGVGGLVTEQGQVQVRVLLGWGISRASAHWEIAIALTGNLPRTIPDSLRTWCRWDSGWWRWFGRRGNRRPWRWFGRRFCWWGFFYGWFCGW